MKDDIHNTVLVDSSKDKAVLLSLGDIQKALTQDSKGTKVCIKDYVCCDGSPHCYIVRDIFDSWLNQYRFSQA